MCKLNIHTHFLCSILGMILYLFDRDWSSDDEYTGVDSLPTIVEGRGGNIVSKR